MKLLPPYDQFVLACACNRCASYTICGPVNTLYSKQFAIRKCLILLCEEENNDEDKPKIWELAFKNVESRSAESS